MSAAPSSFAVASPEPRSPAGTRRCNLVLIANTTAGHHFDFPKVQRFIGESSPNVRTVVWQDGGYRYRRWQLAARPTMVFSPVPLKTFAPVRGRVFAGNSLTKSQEYAALEAAGVPIPRYRILSESDSRPADLEALGKYVVVKPNSGGRGAHVKIVRSSRAHWKPIESTISGKSDTLLAQEFIYTGAWPLSYRVTTLFGQVLWALKVEANHTRSALEAADGFDRTPGLSVVSNSKGCVMSLCNDEEVIGFAEAAHAAFPDIPLLGIDVLRRPGDGRLFVIEVNASGWVWHFSSPLGLRAQAEFGFNFESQFDGLRKAARILAGAAERFAR
jgi:hypothetical protein